MHTHTCLSWPLVVISCGRSGWFFSSYSHSLLHSYLLNDGLLCFRLSNTQTFWHETYGHNNKRQTKHSELSVLWTCLSKWNQTVKYYFNVFYEIVHHKWLIRLCKWWNVFCQCNSTTFVDRFVNFYWNWLHWFLCIVAHCNCEIRTKHEKRKKRNNKELIFIQFKLIHQYSNSFNKVKDSLHSNIYRTFTVIWRYGLTHFHLCDFWAIKNLERKRRKHRINRTQCYQLDVTVDALSTRTNVSVICVVRDDTRTQTHAHLQYRQHYDNRIIDN